MSVLLDADSKLKELSDLWESLTKFHDNLWELFDANDIDETEMKTKIDFDSVKEIQNYRPLKNTLQKLSVVIAKQVDNKKDDTSPEKETDKDKAPLKMDRIQTPKFSGKAEDFASWKERFCALVPKGRDDAEISVLLEQAIPETKRYLLQ